MNTVLLHAVDSFQTLMMFLAISNTKLLNALVIAVWTYGTFSHFIDICEPPEVLLLDQDKYSEVRTELKDLAPLYFGICMFFISFIIFFKLILSVREQFEHETEITKS